MKLKKKKNLQKSRKKILLILKKSIARRNRIKTKKRLKNFLKYIPIGFFVKKYYMYLIYRFFPERPVFIADVAEVVDADDVLVGDLAGQHQLALEALLERVGREAVQHLGQRFGDRLGLDLGDEFLRQSDG